jgi:hypothetical protein
MTDIESKLINVRLWGKSGHRSNVGAHIVFCGWPELHRKLAASQVAAERPQLGTRLGFEDKDSHGSARLYRILIDAHGALVEN